MKRISIGTLILIIYVLLVYYFGFNTYQWLQTWNLSIHPVLFGIMWFLLGFGYIIGKFSHGLKYFSMVGSYWFIVMQYGMILFPISSIIYLIWPSQQTIFIVGNVVAIVFLLIFITGTYLAFSPVVRHKTIQLDKESGSLRDL